MTDPDEVILADKRESAVRHDLRVWLRKHRPSRSGGTGLSAQAWVDLMVLFRERMDTSWLAGVSYGRSAEREKIARALEAVDPVEWALYGMDAGRIAAGIARGESRE